MNSDGYSKLDLAALSRRDLLRAGGTAAVGVSALSLLAACGGSGDNKGGSDVTKSTGAPAPGPAKPGGSITIGISDHTDTDSLDPAVNFTIFGLGTSGMLYDTLVRVKNDWELEPMLAEEWSSTKDGRSHTFKLRKGVELHNGKTLEASDVGFCVRRLLDKSVGSGAYDQMSAVLEPSGIKVMDPQTIRFDLRVPDGFFPIKMGWFWTRIFAGGTTTFSEDKPVGSGPFMVRQFRAAQGFEFVKNPNYWQSGRPYLDSVSGRVIPELGARAAALKTGEVDIIDQPDFSTVPDWQNAAYRPVVSKNGPTFEYGIDGTKAPFTDLRVRQAFKMLIDREQYVKFICRGQADVSADSIVDSTDPLYPSDLKPLPYDPEQAKSLLKQAGFPMDVTQTVYTSPPFPALVDGAVIFKQSLEAVGIKARVQSVPAGEFFGKVYLNRQYVVNYYQPQHPSLILPQVVGTNGIYNTAHLSDAKIDGWLAEAQATTDSGRQKELIGEVLRRYNDISSTLLPFHFYNYWPAKARLAGAATHWSDALDLRNAYVTD
jgi:peptide/nickel transport system substrate-binding protein